MLQYNLKVLESSSHYNFVSFFFSNKVIFYERAQDLGAQKHPASTELIILIMLLNVTRNSNIMRNQHVFSILKKGCSDDNYTKCMQDTKHVFLKFLLTCFCGCNSYVVPSSCLSVQKLSYNDCSTVCIDAEQSL